MLCDLVDDGTSAWFLVYMELLHCFLPTKHALTVTFNQSECCELDNGNANMLTVLYKELKKKKKRYRQFYANIKVKLARVGDMTFALFLIFIVQFLPRSCTFCV